MADTTRSMMRKGRKTRNPISKARWISDSRNDGTRTDRGASGIGVAARGRSASRVAKVSGSIRADMNSRNGFAACSKAAAMSSSLRLNGPRPLVQASVKTGSITYQVRNMARLMISMFGGACCKPIPWRRIDRTVTMKGKQVTITASPGTTDSTVISSRSWIDRAASDSPSPSDSVRSCASAGSASRTSATAISARRLTAHP